MKEIYTTQKLQIKLSEKDLAELKNGKIIRGYRVDIGLEVAG